MKKIERIPEYSLEVRFYDNLIECYDIISDEIVASRDFKKRIFDIHRSKDNTFHLLNEERMAIGKIAIEVDLVKEINRISTNAGYIFEIFMDTPNHGFYFGYYEIGEFSLSNNNLIVIKSFPLNFCTTGCVTTSKHLFVGFRETDPIKSLNSYFLAKIDWKDLREVWKKEIPSAIITMRIYDNRLFLGLKNGILQIWDIEKNDLVKSFNLFNSTVTVIEMKDDKMIIASQTGDASLISQDGTVHWKTKLTGDGIIGIHDFHNNIMLIDTKGNLYEINLITGTLLRSDKWNVISVKNPVLVSNIIDFYDWFIMAGYGGIWGFWSKDFEKIFHLYMDDPLIRVLDQHPIGFFSGDDAGTIRFWKLGKVKIRSMGFVAREYLEIPYQEV